MRVTADFFVVRKNGGEVGIVAGEFFDDRAHFREGLNRSEAGARRNNRIGGREAHTVPFFFLGIFCGKKQNFARTVPGIARLPRFQRRENDQASFFFVVAGKVIKIIFLGEDVGLRNLFASSESPEDDGSVSLRGDARATGSVDFVGFAFAVLLAEYGGRDTR